MAGAVKVWESRGGRFPRPVGNPGKAPLLVSRFSTAVDIRASMAEKERDLQVECTSCGSAHNTQVFAAFRVLTRSNGAGRMTPGRGGPGSGRCR